ncbi:DNA/RNA non-specific endonuclease [Bacteroides sp.]|uniref:DNA/RNA non-specific endonuclease n=1 Tax=Bacteroides sp. TaxID=29523 RepID=UPI00263046B4|nr:DNA/RNA non-specific endonuclease [Bacteroides sp.]MDD3038329.1 DNA/RNA non-specific endonuclease [Bacteroides sp.]
MNIGKKRYFYIWLSFLCLSFVSCSKDEEELSSDNFAIGIVELPALRNGANDMFVTHSTTFNGKKVTTFSMEYDKSKKHSRWIAFRFDSQTKQTNVSRSNEPFDADPFIPQQFLRVQADFGRQGYDRGHLCASADRLYSNEANEQTFYYSNMSPQRNKFNVGIWRDLEAKVQTWGRSCTTSDTLYVVKGGTIDREDQIAKYIGDDRSKPVPKYYYMALLFKKSDSFKAIAFWLEHTDIPKSQNLADYVLSIDELEEKTGIDFFPNLNDKLENVLEATYSVKAWNGL